jgi:soluble lytic murein transglycosylase
MLDWYSFCITNKYMKTIHTNKNFKVRFKKFGLLLFFILQIILIEACQFKAVEHEFSVSDAIRTSHAEKLLQGQDNPAEEFNGDANFSRYISNYLKKQNKKLDHDAVTNALMQISRIHGDDPVFLLAVIKTESSFNHNAVGSVGEVGLMQIKPETAEWVSKKNNIAWRGATALKDPTYNILIGSHYFQYLKKSLKKQSADRYVNAYNIGLTALRRLDQNKLKERQYYNRVITNYSQIYSQLKKIKIKIAGEPKPKLRATGFSLSKMMD